jgi:hypothetical protein
LSNAEIRRCERVIDASGVVPFIEGRIAQAQKRPGRPRELSVRALMVALLLLSETGRLHLTRVPSLLNALDVASRRRLGVTREGGITFRQVQRLFALITASIREPDSPATATENQSSGRPAPLALDDLCDLLLAATLHPEAKDARSIAIDGTPIDSWGRSKRKKSRRPSTDPDAAWRGKGASAWKRPTFGYNLTVGVTAPEVGGANVPLAAKAMRLRKITDPGIDAALSAVNSVAKLQGSLSDVLADREYTMTNDGSDFLLPVRALGGEPVFQLTGHQLGAQGTSHGAIIIDGQPFSPSTPKGLWMIEVPEVNASAEKIGEYQDRIALRSQYALVPHSARKPNGSQVFQCPASAGKIQCPLVAGSLDPLSKLSTALMAPATAPPNTVCSRKFTTFNAEDIPLSQRELHGTTEWYFSSSRRNRVEGFFGNLKNEARENIRRGTIRVRGLEKTGLLLLMAVARANLRLADVWLKNACMPVRAKMGRKRKLGVVKYADVVLNVDRKELLTA